MSRCRANQDEEKAVCCNLCCCCCSRKQKNVCAGISFTFLLGFSGLVMALLIRAFIVGEKYHQLVLEENPDLLQPTQDEKMRWGKKLGQAIQLQTVSFSEEELSFKELEELHDYLSATFPIVFNSTLVEVSIVNNYSLLLQVTGSENSGDVYMLAAHLDVVPAGDLAAWDHPPFLGQVINQDGVDYVYGRGAIDDKHNLIGILEALTQMLERGIQPRHTFYIALGHDEEVSGHQGAGHIAQELQRRVQQQNQTVHFILDEGMFVMTDVVPGVEGPVIYIGVAEKGWATIELSVDGEQGHSSRPPRESAIGVLSQAIVNLEDNPHPQMFNKGPESDSMEYLAPHATFLNKLVMANLWILSSVVSAILAGDTGTDAIQRTTTAVTLVSGGVKENVLPPSAQATVNHRVHVSSNLEDVLRHDKEVIDDDRVKIRTKDYFAPSPISDYSDKSLPFQIIANSALQIFPEGHITPGVMIANTDCRHYLNLTSNIYRFSAAHLRPNDTSRFHGANERISIDNFAQVVGFYYRIMLNSDLFLASPTLDNGKTAREL